MKKNLIAVLILLGINQMAYSMQMDDSSEKRELHGIRAILWESLYRGDDDKAGRMCAEDCDQCCQLTAKAVQNLGAFCASWNARKNK
jgi:hypothetical protein